MLVNCCQKLLVDEAFTIGLYAVASFAVDCAKIWSYVLFSCMNCDSELFLFHLVTFEFCYACYIFRNMDCINGIQKCFRHLFTAKLVTKYLFLLQLAFYTISVCDLVYLHCVSKKRATLL